MEIHSKSGNSNVIDISKFTQEAMTNPLTGLLVSENTLTNTYLCQEFQLALKSTQKPHS